jgi:hypothetical protein
MDRIAETNPTATNASIIAMMPSIYGRLPSRCMASAARVMTATILLSGSPVMKPNRYSSGEQNDSHAHSMAPTCGNRTTTGR